MLNSFKIALENAQTPAQIDDWGRVLWGMFGAGEISLADAECVSAYIEQARERFRPKKDAGGAKAPGIPLAAFSRFLPHKRRCVSPDRIAARTRRRELGLVGALPHALAMRFTEGERAVLTIIIAEVKAKAFCDLPLEAIAARAGVCVTLTRDTIRRATNDGLLTSKERRRPGKPSLPNIVRILSPELRMWIWRRGGGYRIVNPKDKKSLTDIRQIAAASQRPKEGQNRKGEAKPGEISRPNADNRGVERRGDGFKSQTGSD